MPDPLSLVQAGAGVVQGIIGGIQAGAAKKRVGKLLAQRKAYQTPDEIYDIVKLTQSRAGSGYDPATLSYLTNQTDRAFNSTLDTARLLGADPNMLGEAFDQKVNNIMKIGAQNHALNMENVMKFIGAKETLAANLAAEQKSREDILKDRIQAEVGNREAGNANLNNGLNTALGAITSSQTMQLFKEQQKRKKLLEGDGGLSPMVKFRSTNNLDEIPYELLTS